MQSTKTFDDIGFNLNGASVKRVGETVFIALPRELWRNAGKCECPICKKRNAQTSYWDTLAVPVVPKGYDYAWTVHMPELHSA